MTAKLPRLIRDRVVVRTECTKSLTLRKMVRFTHRRKILMAVSDHPGPATSVAPGAGNPPPGGVV